VQYVLLGVLARGLLRLLGGSQKLLATVGIALTPEVGRPWPRIC
jgi:hypothetical protein